MIGILNRALIEKGYREMIMTGDNPGYRIYYDLMASVVNAVLFVDAENYNTEFVKNFENSMKDRMEMSGYSTHFMIIVCVDSAKSTYASDLSVARQVCSDTQFAWIYDEARRDLIIYETQVVDFYGLRMIIDNARSMREEDIPAEVRPAVAKKSWSETVKLQLKSLPKVTTAIVAINVVLFLICTFTGRTLYNIGAVGLKLVQSPSQYYRLVSAMFLHLDISHIFNNMVLLFFLGSIVEKEVKPGPFAVMYFFSGIIGNIVNMVSEAVSGRYAMAIGASGAVFGILGALLVLVCFKRVTGQTMRVGRIIVVIVFSIYSGFSEANIANWAHIGGLAGGLVSGLVYCLKTRIPKQRGTNI